MPTIRRIDFRRDKYGPELLVDVAPVSKLPGFVLTTQSHILTFYDILLVTHGRGTFLLDGTPWLVHPGQVFFTSPGQVRQWRASGVEGLCLFFTGEFLERFFSDPLFLYRLPFFYRDEPIPPLMLGGAERRHLTRRLAEMESEIGALRKDSSALLAARLYEALVLMERWFRREHPTESGTVSEGLGLRFRRMVERRHREIHRVSAYAKLLAVSSSHLNAVVRRQLGRSPTDLIQERVALEARRLLLHTDETAVRIGYALGFDDPSYFARFFRRRTERTPTEFRAMVSP
jgi:AraC-like DNA-binding protein